jgi:hypothetical protein
MLLFKYRLALQHFKEKSVSLADFRDYGGEGENIFPLTVCSLKSIFQTSATNIAGNSDWATMTAPGE